MLIYRLIFWVKIVILRRNTAMCRALMFLCGRRFLGWSLQASLICFQIWYISLLLLPVLIWLFSLYRWKAGWHHCNRWSSCEFRRNFDLLNEVQRIDHQMYILIYLQETIVINNWLMAYWICVSNFFHITLNAKGKLNYVSASRK